MSKKENGISIFVLGGALFSMFFGAGNLIFPPILGLQAGTKWFPALFGFFLTGIGLPLLGVMASAKADGDLDKLGRRVSPGFSKFLGIAVSIAIGPLLAIPRTGATAYEMAGVALFPSLSAVIFSAIYFGITLILVLNPTGVVDTIGKYLTPGLLVLLAIIIVMGVVNPAGEAIQTAMENPFAKGFTEGYQTMDALASILFGGIIVASLREGGVTDKKEQVQKTLKAGLVAVAGLTFVYGGLGYLGAQTGTIYPQDISRVQLIMNIAENSLKSFGKIALAIVVSLACLTTAVGLVSAVSKYFEQISNGKLKYKWLAIGITLFSAIMSVGGVDTIVNFAVPILVFMYPITMVVIILTIFMGENPNKNIYRGGVIFAMLVSILEILAMFDLASFAPRLLEILPLSSWSLPWLLPALVGMIIGAFIPDKDLA